VRTLLVATVIFAASGADRAAVLCARLLCAPEPQTCCCPAEDTPQLVCCTVRDAELPYSNAGGENAERSKRQDALNVLGAAAVLVEAPELARASPVASDSLETALTLLPRPFLRI
jgi:hypothetical protein